MKVLIYGVNGFLGGNLAAYLTKAHQVVGIGSKPALDASLQGVVQKYFQYNDAVNYIDQVKPDLVLFCISLDHNKSNENAVETIEVNLNIYARLIEFIRNAQDWRGKLVYFSTAQVLENSDIYSSKIELNNIYSLTHYYCEFLGKHYLPSNCYNLRLPNVVGVPASAGANIWWNIVPDILRTAVLTGQMKVRSNGKPIRTFLSVADFCVHVEQIILGCVAPGTYNITSNQCYTIAEVTRLALNILQRNSISVTLSAPRDFDLFYKCDRNPAKPSSCNLQLETNQSLENVMSNIIEYLLEV